MRVELITYFETAICKHDIVFLCREIKDFCFMARYGDVTCELAGDEATCAA